MDLLNYLKWWGHVHPNTDLVSDIDSWSFTSYIILGFVLCCIFLPFFYNTPKAVAKRFHKLHPDEELIYIIKNSPIQTFIFTHMIGGLFGLLILPFFVFNYLYMLRHIHPVYIYLFLLGYIFCVLPFIFLRFCIIYVLTDKNIRLVSPYKILDKYLKTNICIPFDDIKGVKFNRFLNTEHLEIELKNGEMFNGITGCYKLKNVKKIIEKILGVKNE